MDIQTFYIGATVVLTLCLVTLELVAPARVYSHSQKKNSYITNTLIFLSNNVVTLLLQVSAVFAVVLSYSPSSTFFTTLPMVAQGALGVLLLDFGIWLWHRLNHTIPFLWAFHKCHHSETYLNASSALRFHIGELLLSVLWKSLILIIVGIPLWVFLLSEFLLTFFALFHHANIHITPRIRHMLEWVVITPYLHRVHHSAVRNEHDTNYGVILSVWDRLFGSLHKTTPQKIGLRGVADKNIIAFLLFPFSKK